MPEQTQLEQLRCGAAELGLELSRVQAERLLEYQRLLQRWNEKFNLVSRRDVGRLLSRHLLDSLSIEPWLLGERVVDVGSGAGFPGLPLAMVNAGRQFLLVDRSERKARFLEQAVIALELDNVDVQRADAGDLAPDPGFTTMVCRAVMRLAQMWQLAGPLLDEGGRLLFMSRTSASSEQDANQSTAEHELPDGVNVVRRRVQIPGLPTPHEVLIVEASR